MYVYATAMYFFRSDFSALTFQRFDHTGASFESREYWQCSVAHSFWNSWQSSLKKKKTFLGAGPFSSKPIGCSRLTYIPITCAVLRAVRDWQCSADDKNVIGMYVSREQPIGLKLNGPAPRNVFFFFRLDCQEFQNICATEHCQYSRDSKLAPVWSNLWKVNAEKSVLKKYVAMA